MNDISQTPLFPSGTVPGETPSLTADASLQAVLGAFEHYMVIAVDPDKGRNKFTENTRKAFASDIRLLGKYLGIGQPIGEIGTNNLNDFLNWLVYERGVPCSRKSYARRVTTLKLFFGWLQESGVLRLDPAAAVVQISVSSPLPVVPTETELDRALFVTSAIRYGSRENKADARPHLLLTLLLATGLKKGEVMRLALNHIDRRNPDAPSLFVRYQNPSNRPKERRLPLKKEWLDTLEEYLAQYQPKDALFTCTARNLEYILSDVAQAAGLEQGKLSFENLRWTSALADYRRGVEPDEIRQKLGLSKITWRETKSKLEKLSRAAL